MAKDADKKAKKKKGKSGGAGEEAGDAEAPARLPEHLELQRTRVVCGADENRHTTTATSANMYMPLGVDNSWSYEEFQENFRIQVNHSNREEMEFDMIGVDPSIANAFRRILISEVPTMAIEHVFFVNNTSIIPDEMLAHRLGLVPLAVDPRLFESKAQAAPSEKNTIVLGLNVTCRRVGEKVENDKVFSGQLEWLPEGSQMPDETGCRFAGSQAPLLPGGCASVHDDILLAKLRPGQSIELEAHCIKGDGREHAKWSPVATAWYRMQPEAVLLQPVTGELADELASECPALFVVHGSGPTAEAKVTSARGNEAVLEKFRRLSGEEKWAPFLQLRKVKDHFIYTVQTTGALPPADLFTSAIDLLADKCDQLLARL